MSLKIGIVGLPNVGKSTLFNALTRKKVDVSNYPFCTIEPNIGAVAVPDPRIEKLASLSRSKKIVPAAVEFVDIAGLVQGAAKGEGLGNKFLSHIYDVDAIAEVVRVFDDHDITHVADVQDPLSDIEVLEYELILKDMEAVDKRLESLARDVRAGKKGAVEEQVRLQKIERTLKTGSLSYSHVLENMRIGSGLHLLTEKPFIYVFNVSEQQIQDHWQPDRTLQERIQGHRIIMISAKIESELSDLNEQDRKEYMLELGIAESGLDAFIRTGYETLGLITFFTTGEDETRAWTIPRASKAPRAGRAIHSDFEEKFIRAEVISCNTLLEAGSYPRAREMGALRTEGKEYMVQDGDVMEFKI